MAQKSRSERYLGSSTAQENKELTKKLIKTGIILALVGGAMYFWILVVVSNIDTFWDFLSRGKEQTQPFGLDTTPPPPPYIEALPKFTKEASIKVTGYSEPGAEVKLFFNGRETDKQICNNEGLFNFPDQNLLPGENQFYVIAIDDAGNESQPSNTQKITMDKEPPELIISQPSPGQIFIGENYIVTVTGETEPDATVTVNGHLVIHKSQGDFSYTIALEKSPGEKTITCQAADQALNQTEKVIKVIYHP